MQSLLLLAHVEELLGSANALQSAERALTLSKRCLVARSGLVGYSNEHSSEEVSQVALAGYIFVYIIT